MPLAVVTTGGTLSWVHGDHLGTPILITNAAGAAIAQPTGYTPPAFPGQSKTLADLYYNRHRDYDPTTGRYIQADPIGLAGGASPYSYAEGDPVNLFDPDGLQARPAPRVPMPRIRPPGWGRSIAPPSRSGRRAPKYSPGEQYIGPPGSIPTLQQRADRRRQCIPGGCPPCNPPAGSIRYRFDRVPPSKPHLPYPGSHYHIYTMNQDPLTCRCNWSNYVTDQPPPPGAQPW
jgi:RHS repeat-associated protein